MKLMDYVPQTISGIQLSITESNCYLLSLFSVYFVEDSWEGYNEK